MELRPRRLSTISDVSISESESSTSNNFVCKDSLFILRFVGLWTDDGQELSKFQTLCGYFGAFVTVGIFAFQFTLLTEYTNGEIIANFIAEFLAAETTIWKVLPIMLNRKNMLQIWQKTYQIRSIPKKTWRAKEIADGWDRHQFRLVKIMLWFYITGVIIYLMIPWFDDLKFPLKGVYPVWSKSVPGFCLVYVITTVAFLMRSVTIVAIDFSCIIAMCQLFRELQLVQYLIRQLAVNNNRAALQRAIVRHATVLDYGLMICDNFSIVFMFQLFNIAMSISLLGAVAIYTSDQSLLMTLVLFIGIGALQVVIICYVGEKLMQESLKIGYCIENTYDKFSKDVSSLKSMSMMLLRAQKPLKFNFGSKQLSLSLYSHTVNAIYSFFMILKSMIK